MEGMEGMNGTEGGPFGRPEWPDEDEELSEEEQAEIREGIAELERGEGVSLSEAWPEGDE
jgi:hypothetical protein